MATLAAFLIALPFLLLLVFEMGIGIAVWAMLFFPALIGILAIQLPLKTLLLYKGWRDGAIRPTLAVVNVVQTLLIGSLWPVGLSLVGVAVLSIVAVLAVMIWTALDDRAIGSARNFYSTEAN